MNNNETNHQWDKQPEPYWRKNIDIASFDSLNEDVTVDVGIVGGGITGITTAYLLSKEGVKVALIDSDPILNGTTGHTTAKVTTQHGVIYDELIQHFGLEKTQQYYQANDKARGFIKDTIQLLRIDCDWEEQDAYIYTNQEKELSKLTKEAQAYEKLNISGRIVPSMPLDIPMISALVMDKQAQFHPLKYLFPLTQKILEAGGKIYENTTALDIEETATYANIITSKGHNVRCEKVISCSHYPFNDGNGLYFTRLHAERSYVVAMKSNKPYPGGMYLSSESPSRSVRTTPIGDDNLLLIGGEGHKTGQGINTMKHYEALADFGKEVLGLTDIHTRWSAQDIYTLDNVPYVGQMTSTNDTILVATGYRKWGMTNGTAAAMMLKELIINGKNPYEETFTPSRFKADPSIKTFVTQNTDVAVEFVKGKVGLGQIHPEQVKNGEAAHVSINGQKTCAYRDDNGELHLVDATCKHLGCEVEWNEGEKTWDCPCHGSRYTIQGDIVNGPTVEPLDERKID
ncbi:FAD-dependent oxidoreductase [Bacillus sp. FJAT-45350]|uniref:FAD-dependent oxidoreductase n=1 Tax=Bacillus sp. FJAT-45350 TaxID=2011014 RepID=UPI000BB6D432|nr:FAD-dependent oxidoreductase [Bacillus sp. FJAT-45350]